MKGELITKIMVIKKNIELIYSEAKHALFCYGNG